MRRLGDELFLLEPVVNPGPVKLAKSFIIAGVNALELDVHVELGRLSLLAGLE